MSKAVLIQGLLGLMFLLACSGPTGATPAPVVVANGEELHGAWADGENRVAQFKGIPFAKPPVGQWRWRAPEVHKPRPGPQTAISFAPGCMQGPGGVDWYIGVAAAFGHGPEAVGRPTGLSEDCLYLNIWSPQLDTGAVLPVMVFVHGGGNSGGWAYEPNYIGTKLAARGVVVVSVAYRLGPFGFFAHPVLNNGNGEPVANFGLLDIRQAFQWVQKNIRAFGGDPENITAFGESAGAFNLIDLLAVDVGTGKAGQSLFRRSISQSIGGSLVDRQTLKQEQATGAMLINHLDLESDITADLIREIPAEDLLRAAAKLPPDHYFDAVIDGRTLFELPVKSFRDVNAAGVDIMAGTNADEWYMYVDENATHEDLEAWIGKNAAKHRNALLAEVADELDVRRAVDRLRTARNMLCPSRFLAESVSAGGGQGWVYYFTRQRKGPGGDKLRVYHGTELPYVFDRHDDWLPTDAEDKVLTEAVMDYWVQFATAGNPNLPGRPEWPRHTRQSPGVMELGEHIGAMKPFSTELCTLLGPTAREAELEQP
jgi:para-nitrobenzyl esterase